ncbi:MAG: hypothetical protein A3F72_02710 [Bacteroidetes bacterium RIFCSPLOWO2_12_FULL_35_15]|nr:MAG: hypothetical protein A3F72_02710 [Bacteroidetes bacterium RIFCSPLOWO2_12_FULL_35_15]
MDSNLTEILKKILNDLRTLKNERLQSIQLGDYIGFYQFKIFMDLGTTQSLTFLKESGIIVKKVKRRKFVKVSSLIEYLEKH